MIKQGHQTHNRINEQCREGSSTTMLNDISSAWLTPTLPHQTTRHPDPIWIYHYWQLESINPLIYPIRLSPSGNRSRRCLFIVFVWLSAGGAARQSQAGRRHVSLTWGRRALILPAQRTVRRERGSWVWSGLTDWLVIYWQTLSVEMEFMVEFLRQGRKHIFIYSGNN